jgi:hypothetical protein
MYKLGRNPSPYGAVQFKFSEVFNPEALPPAPAVFGHRLFQNWGMLANDKIGDCVVAGAMHETMIWTREHASRAATFNELNAVSTYSAIGGYVIGDASTDNGLDMAMAASYRRNTGITDANGIVHKVDAYLAIDAKNTDALLQATYLFGAVGLGVYVPSNAGDQFAEEKPWEVERNSSILGGHYVPLVGRNRFGHFLIVTWGRIQACTPGWIQTYCDEAICYLSLEHLDAQGLSLEGYDRPRLTAMLDALPKRR